MSATQNKKNASKSTNEITKLLDTRLFGPELYEYNEHEEYYDYDPITKERVKKIRTVRRIGIH